jgi:putative hydrolase of the HAD superfamily
VIRALVLDYGGVISLDQGVAERAEMEAILGVGGDAFFDAYWRHRLDYDRRDIDAASYWAAVAATLGVETPTHRLDDLVRADGAGWSHLNAEMVEWTRHTATHVPTALLSNMPHEVKDALLPTIREMAPWTAMVFSCDVGTVKPDAAIYLECARALGVSPGEALMVDDRPANVAGAREAGMSGMQFTTAGALKRDLKDTIRYLAATRESPAP